MTDSPARTQFDLGSDGFTRRRLVGAGLATLSLWATAPAGDVAHRR